jgi:ferredoxin-NADP reductase
MSPPTHSDVHTVTLMHRQDVAEGTMAFRFEKPAHFVFTPGQFVELTLVDPSETDAEGNGRAFSIASAPHEDTLMVATRMRDTAFKRVLRNMPPGATVQMEGAFGNFVFHADPVRPAVFLAGGIGITPFRSMIFHAAAQKLPHRLFLFYSNRRPEDAPFLDELQSMQGDDSRYTLVGTMTAPEKSSRPWKGETGFVSPALLSKVLVNVSSPIFYIVGPPGMVTGLRKILKDAGFNERDIRTEEFLGY